MAHDEGYSDNEYEIENGYHTHIDPSGRERRLGPGDRFHPTKKQEEQGSLEGKCRLVNRAETTPRSTGADIGLRSLNITDGALQLGLDEEVEKEALLESDIEPSGEGDRWWKEDIEAYLEQREAEAEEPSEEEEEEGEEPEEEAGDEESAEEEEEEEATAEDEEEPEEEEGESEAEEAEDEDEEG